MYCIYREWISCHLPPTNWKRFLPKFWYEQVLDLCPSVSSEAATPASVFDGTVGDFASHTVKDDQMGEMVTSREQKYFKVLYLFAMWPRVQFLPRSVESSSPTQTLYKVDVFVQWCCYRRAIGQLKTFLAWCGQVANIDSLTDIVRGDRIYLTAYHYHKISDDTHLGPRTLWAATKSPMFLDMSWNCCW